LALESAAGELKADKEVVLAAVAQRGNALRYAADELKDAVMLALFPVSEADKIATDVYDASEDYTSKATVFAERAKAAVAKEAAESDASASAAAAGTAHDDEVARLTAELAAMKAARDFKGMKAAKAALETAKVATVGTASVAEVPTGYVAGDSLQSLQDEVARTMDDKDGMYAPGSTSPAGNYYVKGFAISDPSKYGRLGALQTGDLSGAYRRKSDQLIEADDYDLAEVYDTAATAAAEFWGLEPGLGDAKGWWHWFPGRVDNEKTWGPLQVTSYEYDPDEEEEC